MKTIYKHVDPDNIDISVIKEAGEIVRSGGLVAFPTETVYGLGADALCGSSSEKIYKAKGRPSDNPLIVHIARTDSIYEIARSVPPVALKLAEKYWPGPLTMIFEKCSAVPDETTGGLDTVAVRFPSHPVARALIEASGGYIAAPSANLSGRPSPTLGKHVLEDMDGRIDMIIDSGACNIGLESTIIDLTTGVPMILRPGYVNEKMLEKVTGHLDRDPAVFGEDGTDVKPRAPGMRYRHYAPKGRIVIVSGERSDVTGYIRNMIENRPENERTGVLVCSDDAELFSDADFVGDIGSAENEDEIAFRFYDMLRRCDEENIDVIYSEEFNTPRLGLAIMNRLIKAAGHNIIKV